MESPYAVHKFAYYRYGTSDGRGVAVQVWEKIPNKSEKHWPYKWIALVKGEKVCEGSLNECRRVIRASLLSLDTDDR